MPIHRVDGGYKWGNHGKTYPTREGAEKQMRAAFANGYRETVKKQAAKQGKK